MSAPGEFAFEEYQRRSASSFTFDARPRVRRATRARQATAVNRVPRDRRAPRLSETNGVGVAREARCAGASEAPPSLTRTLLVITRFRSCGGVENLFEERDDGARLLDVSPTAPRVFSDQ